MRVGILSVLCCRTYNLNELYCITHAYVTLEKGWELRFTDNRFWGGTVNHIVYVHVYMSAIVMKRSMLASIFCHQWRVLNICHPSPNFFHISV